MTEPVLAVDIGGTKFSLAVFVDGRMVERSTFPTDRAGGREWMTHRIVQEAQPWQRQYAIERCGIGFGGPVDFPSQRVTLSTHVGGWSEFDLPAFLHQHLGVTSVMDNDANVGALGEYHFGAGQHCDPLFYMTLSTGIGGGIVAAGRILRGADSYAGELGHMTIQPGGPECLCGARGCLEQTVRPPGSIDIRLCCGLWLERDSGQPASELLQDPAFVQRYVPNLALGLKNCIMLLNPARIVIGGGIAKAGDRLFLPLRAELRRQITAWSRARIDVVPSALGDDSVLWGALALTQQ